MASTSKPEPVHTYDKITLPRPVDLRRVAEWTDRTIDEIQALNPELRRWTTPVRDTNYALKVPAGTADVVLAQAGRLAGRRSGLAEVLHREARRHAGADRAEAARQPDRSRGGQLPRLTRRAWPPVRS